MQIVLRERQLDDRSRLVWKPLPSHSGYGDDPGWYFHYSKSTAKIVRHGHMHAKDGSVPYQKYANAMYGMMLKAGSHGQFTRDNSDKWLWKTYCDLLWYVRAGCNKPRFELLAPT